jgi:hypothetical protein
LADFVTTPTARERCEKVGRRGDAINLYKIRKTDALRGGKLPTNMEHKGEELPHQNEHYSERFRIPYRRRIKPSDILTRGSVFTSARQRRKIATRTYSTFNYLDKQLIQETSNHA